MTFLDHSIYIILLFSASKKYGKSIRHVKVIYNDIECAIFNTSCMQIITEGSEYALYLKMCANS